MEIFTGKIGVKSRWWKLTVKNFHVPVYVLILQRVHIHPTKFLLCIGHPLLPSGWYGWNTWSAWAKRWQRPIPSPPLSTETTQISQWCAMWVSSHTLYIDNKILSFAYRCKICMHGNNCYSSESYHCAANFPSAVLEVSESEVKEWLSPKHLMIGRTVNIMGRRFLM